MIRPFSASLLALAALCGASQATHVVRVRNAVVVRPFVQSYQYGYAQNFVVPVYAAPVVSQAVSGCDYGTQGLTQAQTYSQPLVGGYGAVTSPYVAPLVQGYSAGYSSAFTQRVLVRRNVGVGRVFVRQPVVVGRRAVVVRRPVAVRPNVGRFQFRAPGVNIRLFR